MLLCYQYLPVGATDGEVAVVTVEGGAEGGGVVGGGVVVGGVVGGGVVGGGVVGGGVVGEGVVGGVVGEGVVVGGGVFTVTWKVFCNVALPPDGRSTSTSAV